MGFAGTTWVTCEECGQVFGCGCVITNVCPSCDRKKCQHEFLPPQNGFEVCRKCFSVQKALNAP